MHAVLTTWRILVERDLDRLAQLVEIRVGAAEGKLPGGLGWYVVQTAPDALLALDLYEGEEQAQEAAQRLVPAAISLLSETIEFLSQEVVPAAEIRLIPKPHLP